MAELTPAAFLQAGTQDIDLADFDIFFSANGGEWDANNWVEVVWSWWYGTYTTGWAWWDITTYISTWGDNIEFGWNWDFNAWAFLHTWLPSWALLYSPNYLEKISSKGSSSKGSSDFSVFFAANGGEWDANNWVEVYWSWWSGTYTTWWALWDITTYISTWGDSIEFGWNWKLGAWAFVHSWLTEWALIYTGSTVGLTASSTIDVTTSTNENEESGCEVYDVNDDSVINILDIVNHVDFVVQQDYRLDFDFNSDSILNILDIVELVNGVMSGCAL